jgi:uncharacterized protein YndB with AHSA1/START domain
LNRPNEIELRDRWNGYDDDSAGGNSRIARLPSHLFATRYHGASIVLLFRTRTRRRSYEIWRIHTAAHLLASKAQRVTASASDLAARSTASVASDENVHEVFHFPGSYVRVTPNGKLTFTRTWQSLDDT